ncbi:MAG: glutamine-hydrolyzing GMP synthase [Gemmatimonadetes bacterium]|nr:glutamine-hydrolyzing GMP synthase [Gemmatimonadota bacterium]
MTNHKTVLILDFGAQYSQLIARRVRELHVRSELVRYDTSAAEIRARAPAALILSGGPASVLAERSPMPDRDIFELGLPILGICYGLQVMGRMLGGEVAPASNREFGPASLFVDPKTSLFADMGEEIEVWMSHGDRVDQAPPGFLAVAWNDSSPIAAMEDPDRAFFGVQFHPEVNHTPRGIEMLAHFVHDVANCAPTWTMGAYAQRQVEALAERIGRDDRVLLALSGGVDSTVTAALLDRAIGDRLVCVFVDNGLLRLNEAEQVRERYKERMGLNLVSVDASDRFLGALDGVVDPERKRKIIGATFIEVFEAESARLGGFRYLAQGTLYPDVIESVSFKGPSATIKSHHNVGGLPERMKLELVEPLRELFKDEVRALGSELDLDESLIWRQPFPGPGLAVRILGAVTRRRLDILRDADHIVVDEIKRAGLYRGIWQSFAVLLPVQTVGVMGDERTYENVIAVRSVDSSDAMTADWTRLPYDLLARISARIINEVRGVNRVVYDISSKPPSTIEWE